MIRVSSEIEATVTALWSDPELILEGIAQGTLDTWNEKGPGYVAGNVAFYVASWIVGGELVEAFGAEGLIPTTPNLPGINTPNVPVVPGELPSVPKMPIILPRIPDPQVPAVPKDIPAWF